MTELPQFSNGGRHGLELVVVEIQLFQEDVVKKRRCYRTESLSTKVESLPTLSSAILSTCTVPPVSILIGLNDLNALCLLCNTPGIIMGGIGLP